MQRFSSRWGLNGVLTVDSANNTVSNNTVTGSGGDGLALDDGSADNTFDHNPLQGNDRFQGYANNGTDAFDFSNGGKAAGTTNTWTGNKCDPSQPAGLCSTPATQ